MAAWYFATRRSMLLGLFASLAFPVLLSYLVAWAEMSPILHPRAEPPGGWVLVAAMVWSTVAVPIALVSYTIVRAQYLRKKRHAL
jgi:hypothetical protein